MVFFDVPKGSESQGIEAYRRARERHGFDPQAGTVTVMLHAFVGETDNAVRETIRQPFVKYLESSVDLWRGKWADLGNVTHQRLMTYAFERYFHTSALFGSVDRCVSFARQLRGVGVDEIACLVDFGVPAETTLAALPLLNDVRLRMPDTR